MGRGDMTSPFGRRLGRPQPPDPGEPVPSVPPVRKADGPPLRYGALRAAQAPPEQRPVPFAECAMRAARP